MDGQQPVKVVVEVVTPEVVSRLEADNQLLRQELKQVRDRQAPGDCRRFAAGQAIGLVVRCTPICDLQISGESSAFPQPPRAKRGVGIT